MSVSWRSALHTVTLLTLPSGLSSTSKSRLSSSSVNRGGRASRVCRLKGKGRHHAQREWRRSGGGVGLRLAAPREHALGELPAATGVVRVVSCGGGGEGGGVEEQGCERLAHGKAQGAVGVQRGGRK